MSLRILFLGTPEFACVSLQNLLDHGYSIPAVVTAPDKPRGRGRQFSFTPVKELALKKNLQVLQPNSLKDPNFIETLQELKPDLGVVVAFRILPSEVFQMPRLGTFNLHASLLPKYRGAAPINWAIINGERETGVTTFFLQEKVDTGNIILQERVPINDDDTFGTLYNTLAQVGAQVVLKTVQLIESGSVIVQPQDENLATPAPKIFKNDCRIQWNKSAQEVHNFIRGLSPQPTAWTTHKGKVLRIFRSIPVSNNISQPGVVVHSTSSELLIGTKKGSIAVQEIQAEGKRRLPIAEFLRGYRIFENDVVS